MTESTEDRNAAVQDRQGLPDGLYLRLNEAECVVFRAWARKNYTPGSYVNPNWHPIVRDECALMNEEAS